MSCVYIRFLGLPQCWLLSDSITSRLKGIVLCVVDESLYDSLLAYDVLVVLWPLVMITDCECWALFILLMLLLLLLRLCELLLAIASIRLVGCWIAGVEWLLLWFPTWFPDEPWLLALSGWLASSGVVLLVIKLGNDCPKIVCYEMKTYYNCFSIFFETKVLISYLDKCLATGNFSGHPYQEPAWRCRQAASLAISCQF